MTQQVPFRHKMKNTFLRQIAAILTLVVALAPFASLEAAKHNKRKKHRHHRSKELVGAADIQKKAAQYAHEFLQDLPSGALGSVSITEGTNFQAAVQKNVRDLKAAIANSSWPQAAKNAAFWNLPKQLIGGGGSGNWSGETSVGGYCYSDSDGDAYTYGNADGYANTDLYAEWKLCAY